MGSKEKLVERFKKRPKDFTYEETLSLLACFGYQEHTKGATSGSRVRFKNETTGAWRAMPPQTATSTLQYSLPPTALIP